jgi:hypothetical protein
MDPHHRVCQFAHCRTQRPTNPKHNSLLNLHFLGSCGTVRLKYNQKQSPKTNNDNCQKLTMEPTDSESPAARSWRPGPKATVVAQGTFSGIRHGKVSFWHIPAHCARGNLGCRQPKQFGTFLTQRGPFRLNAKLVDSAGRGPRSEGGTRKDRGPVVRLITKASKRDITPARPAAPWHLGGSACRNLR